VLLVVWKAVGRVESLACSMDDGLAAMLAWCLDWMSVALSGDHSGAVMDVCLVARMAK